jgi:stringent starvation protein B
MDQVVAIFARENGQGMAFPRAEQHASNQTQDEVPSEAVAARLSAVPGSEGEDESARALESDKPLKPASRPSLTRIK